MIVPFKAVVDFIDDYRQLNFMPYLTQDKFAKELGISRTQFINYCNGQVKTNGKKKQYTYKYPVDNIFHLVFNNIYKKVYPIKPEDYKYKTKLMIRHLEQKKHISALFIDTAAYISDIENEEVPASSFDKFMLTCAFRRFLFNYLKLWDDESYREYMPSNGRDEGNTPPYMIYEDSYKNYMEQSLTDAQTGGAALKVDLQEHKCDFSFFEKNRLSVISGPGGQGKTLFLYVLRKIHSITGDTFDDVIIVPLIDLTLYELTPQNAAKDWVQDFISVKYPGVDLTDKKKKYLILLDGFNEYRSVRNNKVVEKITRDICDLIASVSSSDNDNLSLVITAREADSVKYTVGRDPGFRMLKVSGTGEKEILRIKKKCGIHGVPFEGTELEKLAGIPIYALMLLSIEDKEYGEIKNRYILMDKVYKKNAEQRLGGELSKTAYDKSVYLYLYYVLLPYVAYHIMISDKGENTYTFRNIDLAAALRDLNKIYRKGYQSLSEKLYMKAYAEYPFPKRGMAETDAYFWAEVLDNEEVSLADSNDISLIKKDSADAYGTYRFSHEEWRDYLVAKFLNTGINMLKNEYNRLSYEEIMPLRFSFNISSDTAHMVLRSFDMYSDPESNAKALRKLFGTGGDKETKKYLFGTIMLLHTAFDFNEYLELSLPRSRENNTNYELHEVLSDLYLILAGNRKFDGAIKGDAAIRLYCCEILSKVAENFRLKHDYEKMLTAINTALIYDENSDIILHQKAKLYLYLFQSKLNKRENHVVPDSLKGIEPPELYKTGMELLIKLTAKGFHLSGNTLGFIKSNPAPYLIDNVPDIKIDFRGAFMSYMKVICGTGYVRRDITYTVRQALNLLLKGYVCVSGDSVFDPDSFDFESRKDLKALILEDRKPDFSAELNEQTLALARLLVRRAAGQDAKGMNYLRGTAALLSGDTDGADMFLNDPLPDEKKLMYMLRLKYCFGREDLDEAIRAEYDDLLKGIALAGGGRLDAIHPVYLYIDARETELALIGESLREQKKQYFAQLEEQAGAAAKIGKIYDFIMR